jgi:hypothetical protein
MLHMQDVTYFNILVVSEFLMIKFKLNKDGVQLRLQDQRRNLQLQNTSYMITAENHNFIDENYIVIDLLNTVVTVDRLILCTVIVC